MKNRLKFIIGAFCIVCAVLFFGFFAKAEIASGTSGTCSWVIDDDGLLTIYPTDGVSGTLEYTWNGRWPWVGRDSVLNVIVDDGVKVLDNCDDFFRSLRNCISIDARGLDISGVTNMSDVFSGCSKLKTVNLSGLDTSSVRSMDYMFYSCGSLTSIDLSDWDVSSLVDADSMFRSCSSLVSIDLSGWNVSSLRDMSYFFDGCDNLEVINFSGWSSTDSLISVNRLFSECKTISSLDLSFLNTSYVSDMSYMFYGCSGLSSLDLSMLDTSRVTNMRGIFNGCSSLVSLNLDGWNTSRVTNMNSAFGGCQIAHIMNIFDLDTSSVVDMSSLFSGATFDGSFDLSCVNTESVTTMSSMFSGCKGITRLDVSNVDFSRVTKISGFFPTDIGFKEVVFGENWSFFRGTTSCVLPERRWHLSGTNVWFSSNDLKNEYSSDLAGIWVRYNSKAVLYEDGTLVFQFGDDFDDKYGSVHKVYENFELSTDRYPAWYSERSLIRNIVCNCVVEPERLSYWFYRCANVSSIDLSGFVTSRVKDMSYMFYECSNVESLDLSGFDVHLVTDMSSLFTGCKKLVSLDLSGWSTGKLKSIYRFFSDCESLQFLDLSGFDTSDVSDMSYLFFDCRSLVNLDISGFNTNRVTTMSHMFSDCRSLHAIDVSSFNTSSVRSMDGMFSCCCMLESIDVSNFNTSLVTTMSSMFDLCYALSDLDLSSFDTHRVTNMSSMFSNCSGLKTIDVSSFVTSSVTTMNYMFCECRLLDFLDLSNFDVSNVTSMNHMFYDCIDLINVNFDSWTPINVSDIEYMFCGCKSFVSLDLSGLPFGKLDSIKYAFSGCSALSFLDISGFNTINSRDLTGVFSSCKVLKKVVLGENFAFKGRSGISSAYFAVLPTPNRDVSNGKWIRNDGEFGPYTSAELRDGYDGSTMAGTWVWDDGTYYIKINSPLFESDKYIVYNDMVSGKNNQTVSLSDNLIKRYGYKLIGWNEDSSSDSVLYATDSVGMAVVPANTYDSHKTINLYAVFEKMDLSVSAVNGEFEFDLPGGSAVSFDDLPGNTQYQVYEETASGWQLVDSGNTSGQISTNGNVVSVFKNHYDPSVARFKLTGQKRVVSSVGNVMYPSMGEYTFKLIDVTGGVNNEIQSVTNSDGGLIAFDEIELDSVGTFTYQVVEVPGDDLKMSYDGHVETVSVSVSDLGDGNLETEVVYDSDGILFVNRLNDTGSLKISKQALNKAGDDCWQDGDKFSFDVVFTDKYGLVPSGGYQNCLLSLADSNGFTYDVSTGILHVELVSDNRSVVVSGIPYGLHYVVNEIVDNNSLYVLDSLSGESGVISDVVSEARFVNVFELVPVSVSFVAYKSADFDLSNGQFSFELLDSNMNVIQTVTNGIVLQDGAYGGLAPVMFDSIDFEGVGSYVYYIREVVGSEDVIYDDSLIKVVVDVNDNNGRLYTDVDYFLVE